MTNTSQIFDYEFSTEQLTLMLVAAVALPVVFASLALTNHEGLRLFHLLVFSRNGATNFYWSLAVLCGFGTLLATLMMIGNTRYPKQVELHPTYANLPKASIMGGQLNIPYDSIRGISRRQITDAQEMAIITSSVGESRLLSSCFNSMQAYKEFLSALSIKLSLSEPQGH